MNDDRIQALLREIQDHRSGQFEIVTRLREIALASGPSIAEEVKYGGILFSSRVGFCGVFSYAQHVTLEFSQGAALTDSYAVLAGTCKHRRHIKILHVSDIDAKHVAHYVELACQAADG